jgi:hypothetical protein
MWQHLTGVLCASLCYFARVCSRHNFFCATYFLDQMCDKKSYVPRDHFIRTCFARACFSLRTQLTRAPLVPMCASMSLFAHRTTTYFARLCMLLRISILRAHTVLVRVTKKVFSQTTLDQKSIAKKVMFEKFDSREKEEETPLLGHAFARKRMFLFVIRTRAYLRIVKTSYAQVILFRKSKKMNHVLTLYNHAFARIRSKCYQWLHFARA